MTRILKRKRLLSLVLALSLLITLMPPLSIPGYSEELTDNAELGTSDSGLNNYGAAIGAVAQWNNVTSVLLASNHFESKGDVCAGVSVAALPKKLAIVDYAYNDANAVLWYKVDAAPGYTWPEEYANYHWVDSYTIRIVSQNGMTGVFDAEGNPVTEATVSTTETVTVKAETSLQSADITYQWQICYDTVNDLWVDITGNDSAEITLTAGMAISLMDENDQVLGDAVAYRDSRNEGMDAVVSKFISPEELYARTGIQKAIFNTVYQLMAVKKQHPEYLEQAETMLHVPDYFHYLLTGEKTCEYTEASTGQLLNPETRDWDYELIDMLGYPRRIFQKLIMPGTVIGNLTDALKEEVGFDLQVVAPATHDTGSAVLAVPANDDDFIYISSGTWSLMGLERETPDCSKKSCEMNLTNEGGYGGKIR